MYISGRRLDCSVENGLDGVKGKKELGETFEEAPAELGSQMMAACTRKLAMR